MKCKDCAHLVWEYYRAGDADSYCDLRQEALDEGWSGCRLSNKYLLSDKSKERAKKLEQEETEGYVVFVEEITRRNDQ